MLENLKHPEEQLGYPWQNFLKNANMAYPKSAITYNESSSAFSSSAKFTFFSSNIFSSSTKQREKKRSQTATVWDKEL